jgi:hypothetical protein
MLTRDGKRHRPGPHPLICARINFTARRAGWHLRYLLRHAYVHVGAIISHRKPQAQATAVAGVIYLGAIPVHIHWMELVITYNVHVALLAVSLDIEHHLVLIC